MTSLETLLSFIHLAAACTRAGACHLCAAAFHRTPARDVPVYSLVMEYRQRMSLTGMAQETLGIIHRGAYDSAGERVDISESVQAAIAGTRLYTPEEVRGLVEVQCATEGKTQIEVTTEGTVAAGERLVELGASVRGAPDVCILNFASARNPGGGFLGGARAQEEELCRCSALYPCLEKQRAYYDANRAVQSAIYTDHLIYSPRVPFFRNEARELLSTPVPLSVITSPAPNTGAVARNSPDELPALRQAFYRRSEQILAVAAANGHERLVLGAWGCGAFQGDPVLVAEAFAAALDGRFQGRFARIVFAVLVRAKRDRSNIDAFRARFPS